MATIDIATVKRLAKLAYPDYQGRKFRIETRDSYTMSNYWDGGTRNYARAVQLDTGKTLSPTMLTEFPYDESAHVAVHIPPGWAILEHSIFCGKDCGITLYVPTTNPALTSAAPALEGIR